ncbi:MAG: hypothetical protein V9E90_10430 [Saprospiraceae bacterium]
MKTYSEKLWDETEGKFHEVEVKEYCYEDWINGISPMPTEPGRLRIFDITNQLINIACLPEIEYNKIIKEKERIYNLRVERQTNLLIDIYKQRHERSEAKDYLLKLELETYEKLFFDEKLHIYSPNTFHVLLEIVLPSANFPDFSKMISFDDLSLNKDYNGERVVQYDSIPYHSETILGIRKLFKTMIVDGIKDYTAIGPKIGDFELNDYSSRHIRVEAMYKYYLWLKENFESDDKEILIECCCSFTQNALRKAISLGLTKNELVIFKEVLIKHPFTDFGWTEFKDSLMKPDVNRMFLELKARIDLIENIKRRKLLIQFCLDDLGRDDQSTVWDVHRLMLLKLLTEYLESENNRVEEIIIEHEPLVNSSKTDLEEILSEIRSAGNLLWKALPMGLVVKHFEVMTKRKSQNGEVFLTTEQLSSFLRKGFLGIESEKKQKINCSRGEKGLVIKLFYQLFDLAVRDYGYSPKKERFIQLIINCFDNWEPTSIATFFRSNKVKDNW